ncbi:hypothetical protein EAH_00056490 [Eimeria acervulina]|uniref:Tyrosine-protein kinase ephrin type A/B receptor-like domain-containing protein n=1 Tax=Eimeria acervulina TaxID=5801 RepID=U6GKZ0_EIMAC|nr:hypothetical protein EAH_00056490 [Eimeria acervulina]CDI80840.1 hypothetical protein EAH_00056490 [Eimeria acervulina]
MPRWVARSVAQQPGRGVYCGDRGTPDLSVPCPGGHYCSVQSPAAMPCLPGTYCPPGSAMPIQCPGGSFCPMMSAEPSACPQGFFCPEGARTPVACPAGSRMNPYDMLRSSSSTACEPCAEGSYSDSDGSADCTPCQPGYLCQEGCSSKYAIETPSGSHLWLPRRNMRMRSAR